MATAGLAYVHETQTAAATIDLRGHATYDDVEFILLVDFEPIQLTDGSPFISCVITEDYSGAIFGYSQWIMGGTRYAQDVIAAPSVA